MGPHEEGKAVSTSAGQMNARCLIYAIGPSKQISVSSVGSASPEKSPSKRKKQLQEEEQPTTPTPREILKN